MKPKMWTEHDKRWLKVYAKHGWSSSRAAEVMGRTPGAVRQMAIKMKLRFSSLGRAHSIKQKKRWRKS